MQNLRATCPKGKLEFKFFSSPACLLKLEFFTETVWNVWVWTSDMRGAGTDANVFMTLYGDKGKTDEVQLGNATDNFEQGQLDKFKVYHCFTPDLVHWYLLLQF